MLRDDIWESVNTADEQQPLSRQRATYTWWSSKPMYTCGLSSGLDHTADCRVVAPFALRVASDQQERHLACSYGLSILCSPGKQYLHSKREQLFPSSCVNIAIHLVYVQSALKVGQKIDLHRLARYIAAFFVFVFVPSPLSPSPSSRSANNNKSNNKSSR